MRLPTLVVFSSVLLFAVSGAVTAAAPSPSSTPINSQDVDGHPVAVNGLGHVTLVMYTNPDLEDASRKLTLALDRYRDRPNFTLVRVVDLRGDVPPQMRGMVRGQIRKEQVREAVRLKKAGVSVAGAHAPIIPDFSGSTLNALGWDSTYDTVHVVVYDAKGREIKRVADASDPKVVTRVVAAIL